MFYFEAVSGNVRDVLNLQLFPDGKIVFKTGFNHDCINDHGYQVFTTVTMVILNASWILRTFTLFPRTRYRRYAYVWCKPIES